MERVLYINPQQIKEILDLIHNDVEYGGYFVYKGTGDFEKRVTRKGEGLSVSVETENYELHWHTHPDALISSGTLNQTGPLQPPSIDDIAQTSYKFFSYEFLMGYVLVQAVFTDHAIYIQKPNADILESLFPRDFTIQDDQTKKIWEDIWYNPFRNKAKPYLDRIKNIGLDLGGYFNEDTGEFEYYPQDEMDEMMDQSLKLESKYFEICRSFGVDVTKITDIDSIKKNGLKIKVF